MHGLGERVRDARAHPDHGRLLDAKFGRNGVSGLEADAADVTRQPIWVLGHHLDGIRAVGLEDADRPRRADAMAVQEDHDLPNRLLLGPGGTDPAGANRADAVDLSETRGFGLDDLEDVLAERPDELLGVDRPDAPNHARREIPLDAVHGG